MIKMNAERHVTMSEIEPVLEEFQDFLRTFAKGQVKQISLNNFRRGVWQLVEYFGLPLGAPTADDIKRVITKRLKYRLEHTPRERPKLVKGTITNNTYNAVLQCLRKWLAFHDIDVNQPEFNRLLVSKPRTARREKTKDDLLTPADVESIIGFHSSPMWKAFTSVLWDTGARPQELFSLDYGDVKRDTFGFILSIRDSKSATRQLRLITPLALRVFGSYYTMHDGTGPLFKDKSGKRLQHYHTTSVYKNSSRRLGKKVYPYLFRKSASTYWLSSGLLDVAAIRVRLGHSPWSKTFERHYHAYFNSDYEEAELRALGVVEEPTVRTKPRKCWRCGLDIEEGQKHCGNCFAASSGKTLLHDIQEVSDVREEIDAMKTALRLVVELLEQDPEIKERMKTLIAKGVALYEEHELHEEGVTLSIQGQSP